MANLPSYEFAGVYYFDILRSLTQYIRKNVPEITDESDEEPFIQLIRAWALAHHYSNVLLDVAANETLLPTARLLESVRSQLKLIDFTLSQAKPASTEIVLEFSTIFNTPTLIVPITSRFGTADTEDTPQIIYEAIEDYTVDNTGELTYVYSNTSVAITLSNKSGNLFDYVSAIVPAEGDLIYQSGNYAIVTEIVDGNTIRVNDATSIFDGAALLAGSNFGVNRAVEAVTPALPFTLHGAEPQPGDMFYLGHSSILWDQLDIDVTQNFLSGVTGVWEFYDGSNDDKNPDLVTNLGPNLEFDLTSLLGDTDRSGTVVTITYVPTSASEQVVSVFSGGINKAFSTGLLGQVTPSEAENDYTVGTIWQPLEVVDGTVSTGNFSIDGTVTYALPQTLTENWVKTTVNTKDAYWLRFRVQSLTKTAATVTGTGFNAAGLDSANYAIKLKIDGFPSTEIDVTGDLGAFPGSYTLTSVVAEINAALALVDISLASVASIDAGQVKLTAPDPSLGKDSLIRFDAPALNDATTEVFGLAEAGYPQDYIGIGGTPVFEDILISEGLQYLVVNVSQGSTTVENPLGSSSGDTDQQFTLGFRPLIEGTLVVEVDEGFGFTQYDLVSNFLSSDGNARVYTLEIKADDTAIVTFGDGVNGKIPPSGVSNIRATYKIGADVDGNVGAQTIVENVAGIGFVNRVFNPRSALGWLQKEGFTDESLAKVKIEGPASIRTLGRAITVPDIEFLAKTFTSPTTGSRPMSRARAIEETFGLKTIELVAVGQGGVLLTQSQREEIDRYFNGDREMGVDGVLVANHEVTTVNYTPLVIDVTATVTGGNAESIKNAITAILQPDATFRDNTTFRWEFGSEIPTSLIIAAIHETDPTSVKKVVLTAPAANITLNSRELPISGTISITVI